MQKLNAMIVDMLGPFGPLMLVGMLGVFLILLTLPILMKKSTIRLIVSNHLREKTKRKVSNFAKPRQMTSSTNTQTF